MSAYPTSSQPQPLSPDQVDASPSSIEDRVPETNNPIPSTSTETDCTSVADNANLENGAADADSAPVETDHSVGIQPQPLAPDQVDAGPSSIEDRVPETNNPIPFTSTETDCLTITSIADNVNLENGATDADSAPVETDHSLGVPTLPRMALIQQEIPTDTEPFKGQQFSSKQEMENTINSYLSANGYVCKYENGFIPDKKYPDYLIYRWRCERAGKPSKKGTGQRKCVSLKCDCKFKISCVNPKDDSTNIRDCTKFQITGICLEHTGGCLGKDHDMNQAILKRQGRKYDTSVLDLIKSDVISGRYSTSDVQSKLIEVGCREVSLAEATNLRYRLKRGLPGMGSKE